MNLGLLQDTCDGDEMGGLKDGAKAVTGSSRVEKVSPGLLPGTLQSGGWEESYVVKNVVVKQRKVFVFS